jgi:hypothetical protein
MARISEIAPDVYRISIYAPWGDLQFNHFLIRDQEPLLFQAGRRAMFREVGGASTYLPRRAFGWKLRSTKDRRLEQTSLVVLIFPGQPETQPFVPSSRYQGVRRIGECHQNRLTRRSRPVALDCS